MSPISLSLSIFFSLSVLHESRRSLFCMNQEDATIPQALGRFHDSQALWKILERLGCAYKRWM
jgi:hypothetical protein